MTGVTSGVAPVHGVELAYECRGDGETFVLVHGWTGSGRGWSGVIDRLAERRRVVVFDHRGHGRSTNTGDPATYTLAQLADDFAALADAIGLDSFHLLGHSMGGSVAMRYAVAHPARLRSLVLMDTGAASAPGSAELMQPLVDIVEAGGTAAYYEAAKSYVGLPGAAGDAARAAFKWDIEHVDPVAFVALAHELCRFGSMLDQLRRLAVPTTVIVGEHDTHLRGAADDLAGAIAGAALEVIPAAAHLPHTENTEAWLAAVERHFARVGGGVTR